MKIVWRSAAKIRLSVKLKRSHIIASQVVNKFTVQGRKACKDSKLSLFLVEANTAKQGLTRPKSPGHILQKEVEMESSSKEIAVNGAEGFLQLELFREGLGDDSMARLTNKRS